MNAENFEQKITRARKLFDEFIDLSKKTAITHPYMVVILMHDYFRNMYPNDPFITKRYAAGHIDNILESLTHAINTLKLTSEMGSYFPEVTSMKGLRSPDEAHDVYAKLWLKLSEQYVDEESGEVLRKLFENNGQSVDLFREKKVLDLGCGSGRFTLGFEPLGAAEVTGLDLGKAGIQIGNALAQKKGLKKTKFVVGDVLKTPFENESFDFIFCKGVLHHTKNLEGGFAELYRLLRKGGHAFVYCYGDGGIFWDSRTKMREVFKLIPMDYTVRVLDMIGMPSKRYIFADNWYVPIENHLKRSWLEEHLKKQGYASVNRSDDNGDKSVQDFNDTPEGRALWGDGELRYFITK